MKLDWSAQYVYGSRERKAQELVGHVHECEPSKPQERICQDYLSRCEMKLIELMASFLVIACMGSKRGNGISQRVQ